MSGDQPSVTAPRRRGNVRAVARLVRRHDLDQWLVVAWTLRALPEVRRQLRDRSPEDVEVRPLPRRFASRPEAVLARASLVRRTLERSSATCLPTAVIRQRWVAAGGERRDVVVGVGKQGSDFAAHAWLQGDPLSGEFEELTRYPCP